MGSASCSCLISSVIPPASNSGWAKLAFSALFTDHAHRICRINLHPTHSTSIPSGHMLKPATTIFSTAHKKNCTDIWWNNHKIGHI